MSSLYEKRPLDVNGNMLGMVLQGSQGSADLVAVYNMVNFRYSSVYGHQVPVTEDSLKSIINYMLQKRTRRVEGISSAHEMEVNNVLANIRTDFSLRPRLSGHMDFENNASYMLCRILDLPVLHGWVLNPDVSGYESLKEFSHDELVEYSRNLKGQDDHLSVCQDLLHDSSNQLTSYGFNSLSAELNDDAVALLFCRNRLDIIHKHDGVLLTYVTHENIRKQMPEAVWMLFEECQESNIYFTEKYLPVEGQPCEEKATEWYGKFLRKKAKTAARNKRKKDKMKAKKMASQQGPSDDAAPESSEPSETTGNEGEDKYSDELTPDDKRAEAVGSHHSEGQDDTGSSAEEAKRAEAVGSHHSECQDDTGSSPEEAKRAKAVVSHHSEGLDSIGSSPEEDKEAVRSVSQEGVEASLREEVDNVPEGVASDFLRFLIDFKDDGCSEPYFKGIVAAFTSHRPLFYVPYDFIVAHDELLALKIQDNYSRISEDLKKSVVRYLSMNGVCFPDAVLKIIGLSEPKSVQLFLDFVQSIVLHEHYVVYGGDPEALPSSDSRRMGLGYLSCIVTKFRTGRCWAGKWSEANMKVKNKGSEFVIDCGKDYELDANSGFLDLSKFSTTVLERLRFNGRFPPYFDELGEDMMLINDCFGKPEKWERFLELISYPLALKPPLVRASFICNVYIGANANSSADPPRYSPLFSRKDCFDWRPAAWKHQLLRKVYEFQNDRKTKKLKYLIDNWNVYHWHVFKFSRHFIQHVLRHTKDEDLIQKIKDISVVDILLSRTIWKAIAKSVRFLVLNCGVDGLFSSAWRHYVRSDYVDKPNRNLEDATTADMLQGSVDSISDDKITGYVYSEVSIFSEPKHLSVIFSDADLTQLQTQLNDNDFKCEVADDGRLHCGSIILWKSFYHPAEEIHGRTVIVLEGPFSAEYQSVFVFLTG